MAIYICDYFFLNPRHNFFVAFIATNAINGVDIGLPYVECLNRKVYGSAKRRAKKGLYIIKVVKIA